ncbi:general secretion pathway protein C [Plesiocystis pacifica SIR-1]|uniref:General secretion pathway protein C n=1 Tax=Plesiocystis pacifica SIR-1 TaxID=391625 RepID=A6FZI8_9BACT|nr:type II secretion system protein GspC [Plesiocystis pacifica]EDM81072.1 general secretion pathway protein C [Plesiocystis pacifica SIR-1]
MEATLKKYFWLIKLAGVAAVVFFAASAGVNMFGSKFLLKPAGEAIAEGAGEGEEGEEDGEDPQDAARKRQQAMLDRLHGGGTTVKSMKEGVAKRITDGRMFCPTCEPEVSEEEAAADPMSMSGPVRPGEIKSRLPLQLLATMESDDPTYSMATILHTDTNILAPYSPQDQIRAGVVVQRVERGRVVFLNGRQMEYIELGAGAPPPPPPAAKPTLAPETKGKDKKNSREIEGAADAISCDGDFTSCTVDKRFVEKLLSNPAQLARQARIVPAVRDGETKGYKFYGIRPGSLPKLLGMKNGDLLTTVNGNQLKSIDSAMNLYTKLRNASHLSVTIERKGETVQKEIDIK